MTNPTSLYPICSICNKPVALETSKTDGEGRPVHEECYVQSVTGKKPVKRD